ncbi:hypothetical protein VIOR3934_11027 [Vibrio orientalis CIP 102891 = ATCC 33934]|uniref:Uncharacterized protein n=1 Tax=Vibrio orientalis CIP 102891 = ATCC 33934 TaxID=675816 RepID=F9SS50_VIBOR|nr:hypothetical protein VIOR3934_11027 [Vibrio orientalis CIP 102891 = ATCC 33934]
MKRRTKRFAFLVCDSYYQEENEKIKKEVKWML